MEEESLAFVQKLKVYWSKFKHLFTGNLLWALIFNHSIVRNVNFTKAGGFKVPKGKYLYIHGCKFENVCCEVSNEDVCESGCCKE